MKKIGVIISGCGFLDGAEIHETVAALAALENHNLQAVCLAPDVDQMHVVNHLTGEEVENETRNVLVESARIARGNIHALRENSGDKLDGIILPGGFGAAKNFSDYAVQGEKMTVSPIVAEVVKRQYKAGKPIAALCIAPILLASLLKDQAPSLTLGGDSPHAENLEKMGGKHQTTTHEEVVVDEKNKLITGPCYMLNASVGQIIRGAEAVVSNMLQFL